MSWSTDESKLLVNSLLTPFKTTRDASKRSEALSKREKDPRKFLKRITPQVLEVYEKGLSYSTPEEWDESFVILGGGQSRRKSESILERMTWSQFLDNFNQIIDN